MWRAGVELRKVVAHQNPEWHVYNVSAAKRFAVVVSLLAVLLQPYTGYSAAGDPGNGTCPHDRPDPDGCRCESRSRPQPHCPCTPAGVDHCKPHQPAAVVSETAVWVAPAHGDLQEYDAEGGACPLRFYRPDVPPPR